MSGAKNKANNLLNHRIKARNAECSSNEVQLSKKKLKENEPRF